MKDHFVRSFKCEKCAGGLGTGAPPIKLDLPQRVDLSHFPVDCARLASRSGSGSAAEASDFLSDRRRRAAGRPKSRQVFRKCIAVTFNRFQNQ